MKKLFLGAAYYPELWNDSEVENDIARCKSLGINCLRIGEFAWSKIEPHEGVFNLDWLVRIVNRLYENGIFTVMCTPTCTPPRWMLNKYEEMRRVDSHNARVAVSSRCHVCKTSPKAREKNQFVTTSLAERFSDHKGVIGWQIDNEIYPYDEGCYCELCVKAFRNKLKEEYDNISALNKSWGMARWSLEYSDFDEIDPPYPDEWRHPSLRNAWWKFHCSQIKSYVDEQAEILHKYNCKNIGTDMMQNNCLSYYAVNDKLDKVQFNHYNTAIDLPETAFSYDFLRCVKDEPFWVTETQVGWNGSEYADSGYRPVGNCYVNTWLPITMGAEMNLYWLFRAHKNGHEIGHGALYSAAGRAYRVSDEAKRAIEDISKCEELLTQNKIKSKIALHYSSTAVNCFGSAPLIKNFDYRKTLVNVYHAAFRHYNIDVIDTPHSLDGYSVVLSPFLAFANEYEFVRRITEWVNNGGTWIVGPMSDIFDNGLSRFSHAPYGFLEEFAGVYTKYQKPIDNNVFKAKWTNGDLCGISTYFDAYEPKDGTVSLAVYDGGEFNGLSVVTERKFGKGKIILLGSVLSSMDILRLIGLTPISKASDNVMLIERDKTVIAIEMENKPGYIALDGEFYERLTEKSLSGSISLSPYSVSVFTMKK